MVHIIGIPLFPTLRDTNPKDCCFNNWAVTNLTFLAFGRKMSYLCDKEKEGTAAAALFSCL